jgi:hypothetical protein
MRIVDIRERAVPISRYRDPSLPLGGLIPPLAWFSKTLSSQSRGQEIEE